MTHRENQEIISVEDFGQYLFDDYEAPTETNTKQEEGDDTLDIGGEVEEQQQQAQTEVEQQSTEAEEPEQQEQTVVANNYFKDIVEDFIKSEEWEDYQVEHGDKVYDSILDLIQEVEITPELFKGLLATQTQGQIKKLEEKAVILKDDIDPVRAEIVKAIASGLSQYEPFVQTYDNVIEPLKKLDLSEQQTAESLIAKYYKEVNKWEDDYIRYKINQHKKELELEETAENIRRDYIQSFQSILEEEKQKEQQALQEAQKQQKEAQKRFKQYLKENEYDDPFIAKALPLVFAEDGGETHWSKEIKHRMQDDPQFKAELAHWLLNKEDYINKKIAPIKREEKLKTINTVNLLGAAKKKTPTKTTEEDDGVLDIFGIT